MKLYEEFEEYEGLWESDTNTGVRRRLPYISYSNEKRMYTLPNGQEIDLNNADDVFDASEQYYLQMDSGSRDLSVSDNIVGMLNAISYDFNAIDQIQTGAPAYTKKGKSENQRIVNRLRNETDLANKVDLDDLLGQLNAGSMRKEVIRFQTHLKSVEKALQDLYAKLNKSGQ
jgi:hypothetical protein